MKSPTSTPRNDSEFFQLKEVLAGIQLEENFSKSKEERIFEEERARMTARAQIKNENIKSMIPGLLLLAFIIAIIGPAVIALVILIVAFGIWIWTLSGNRPVRR